MYRIVHGIYIYIYSMRGRGDTRETIGDSVHGSRGEGEEAGSRILPEKRSRRQWRCEHRKQSRLTLMNRIPGGPGAPFVVYRW